MGKGNTSLSKSDLEANINDDYYYDANNENDDASAICVRKRSPKKKLVKWPIKRKVFAKSAGMLTKRGYRVVNDVPEFYYVTKNTMVCPPLDGLQSSEQFLFEASYECQISKIPFAEKLRKM